MCGLAGIVAPHGADSRQLIAMSDVLMHRGPDGEGYALMAGADPPKITTRADVQGRISAGLAHRRLEIIDPTSASDQPMRDASGRFVLVYNGELYNYLELRRELEAAGRRLRTAGDTEVVLESWAHWGPSCVERFVGMWAFALLDLERRELVLCRDRFGIKPLFYAHAEGALYFASEIKALLAVLPSPEPHEPAVAAFLLAAVDTSTQTFFDGVRRLEPAHRLTVPLDRPLDTRPERYWSIPDGPGRRDPDAVERFAQLFHESVGLHTRSDVPVGTCLSGGLDSSAIVCTASALRDKGVLPPNYRHHAFGYVPPDGSVSERHWMDLVVRQTGVELTEVRPDPESFDAGLEQIVAQQDEPFGSTSIAAQWFVFRAAREAGLKVMLDGQGADEALGGYHSYLTTVAAGMISERRPLAFGRLALAYRWRLGQWPLPAGAAAPLLPPPVRSVVLRAAARRAAGAPSAPRIEATVTERLRSALEPREPLPNAMQPLLRHQVQTSLPSLLRYEDRNSMAHSIEARVPFLDHRLIELAFSLPAEAKVRGAETKRLLREAMKGVLPEAIRTRRDKLGFRADPAAAARFASTRRDVLVANRTPAEEAWFRPAEVAALIDAAQHDGRLDFPLWRLVNVKLWLRAHWGGGVSS